MKHDELLTKIDEFNSVLGDNIRRPFFNALSAVVELHKPLKVKDLLLCKCEPLTYPCPTIQTIEQELLGE